MFQVFSIFTFMNILSRITINPNVMHSKPTIRNMRWTVEIILDMLGSGMTIPEILEEHSELEKEDILACLQYAKIQLSGLAIDSFTS